MFRKNLHIVPFLEMLFGTVLTAAAFGFIIIPKGFAAAGVTGLAKVITGILSVPASGAALLSATALLSGTVLFLNVSLLIVGWIFVGKAFVTKTLAVSVMFPVILEISSRYPLYPVFSDSLLSATLAGSMLGVGAGLILRSGASSGGFDILAVTLNKKFGVPVNMVMNLCDLTVILLQAMGQPFLQTVYGIITICISAAFVGRVVTYGKGESQVMIYSDHYEEIKQSFLETLDVGLTLLDAETGFKNKPIKVIVSVMPYEKISCMKKLILQIDPTAFVVVNQIQKVLGKGYTLDKHYQEG